MSAVVISGNTSGSITLDASAVSGSTVYTLAPVSGTISPLVSGTAVASTSGTSIDFTGIPSWAKRITVMFNGVSTNGTSSILIKLGDSGGVEDTEYLGVGFYFSTGGNNTISNAGFFINTFAQATTVYGQMVINLINLSANTWLQNGIFSSPSNTLSFYSSGSKSLSGTLDRIRITTVNGTDLFDAGEINIMYE